MRGSVISAIDRISVCLCSYRMKMSWTLGSLSALLSSLHREVLFSPPACNPCSSLTTYSTHTHTHTHTQHTHTHTHTHTLTHSFDVEIYCLVLALDLVSYMNTLTLPHTLHQSVSHVQT